MDAGLAKVLNGTVGTPEFKSLDKILYGLKTLTPSENIYLKIGNADGLFVEHTGYTGNTKTFAEKKVATLRMLADGGFNIGATLTAYDNSKEAGYSANCRFRVYRNNTLLSEVQLDSYSSTSDGTMTTPININWLYFKEGDVIEFKLYCALNKPTGAYTGRCGINGSINILADSVDTGFALDVAD